jgi:hypothetical protein
MAAATSGGRGGGTRRGRLDCGDRAGDGRSTPFPSTLIHRSAGGGGADGAKARDVRPSEGRSPVVRPSSWAPRRATPPQARAAEGSGGGPGRWGSAPRPALSLVWPRRPERSGAAGLARPGPRPAEVDLPGRPDAGERSPRPREVDRSSRSEVDEARFRPATGGRDARPVEVDPGLRPGPPGARETRPAPAEPGFPPPAGLREGRPAAAAPGLRPAPDDRSVRVTRLGLAVRSDLPCRSWRAGRSGRPARLDFRCPRSGWRATVSGLAGPTAARWPSSPDSAPNQAARRLATH